jgi:hypothetical protein
MAGEGEFGPRLSNGEYDRAIIDLHRGMTPMPTPDANRVLRRRALDLAVDHRLGREFPQARRDALWAASERVESKRLWLGLRSLLGLFFPGRRQHAAALTRALVKEYRQVLSASELEQFLGTGPLTLPLDTESNRENRGKTPAP